MNVEVAVLGPLYPNSPYGLYGRKVAVNLKVYKRSTSVPQKSCPGQKRVVFSSPSILQDCWIQAAKFSVVCRSPKTAGQRHTTVFSSWSAQKRLLGEVTVCSVARELCSVTD